MSSEQASQHPLHVTRGQRGAYLNGQTLPGELVTHAQQFELRSIAATVVNEVVAPDVTGIMRLLWQIQLPFCSAPSLFARRHLGAQRFPQTMNALEIGRLVTGVVSGVVTDVVTGVVTGVVTSQ